MSHSNQTMICARLLALFRSICIEFPTCNLKCTPFRLCSVQDPAYQKVAYSTESVRRGQRENEGRIPDCARQYCNPLNIPSMQEIAEPSGLLIGPRSAERVGDVSNVVFTNGAIARDNGDVYIYYASSDTRMHVATTTIDKLIDYVFHTPKDPLRSVECVAQRCDLIKKNLDFLATQK